MQAVDEDESVHEAETQDGPQAGLRAAPWFAGATSTAEWMTWLGLQAYAAAYEEEAGWVAL